LIGDAAKAEQTLAKLRTLGAETPFEFPELADAGRKLIAFGESADTVPATLRRIGDVSAGIQAPINEIAEIYGKARVQGRLFAEDVNQLTGRGIPVIGELAKQFGVNESQVRKLVESGQVGFPQIEKAFINMTSKGGKFSGMMETQSKTTKGLFSTLKDAVNEVFLSLGQPINDAIRPLVAEAIGLVSTLTPLATEAGARIKDAIMFVVATFKSGQFLALVSSCLQLAFANGTNALIKGFEMALSFFWNLLTDGSMWKGLGTILLGVVAGFGAALLSAFQTPLIYLQAGMEYVMNTLLWGLAKIPGMSDLLGFESQDVESNFSDILKRNKAAGASIFGVGNDAAEKDAQGLMTSGASGLAGSVAAAAKAAGATQSNDFIDTSALRDSIQTMVGSIRESMPKPDAVKQATKAVSKPNDKRPGVSPQSARLDPIVTSLGKVGGGGYSTGMLDAQRENNRLTGETNRLLNAVKTGIDKLSGGSRQAAFG
jgi:tape measure domain-containing protein